MSGRLVLVALFLVVASIGAGVAASTRAPGAAAPAATCTLPGTIPCQTDPECVSYDAVCDTQAGVCVCTPGDLGADLGAADLGGRDLAGADLLGATVGAGGPPVGGGMTSTPRSGCSFVPGAR